ncbi:hypothetical protein J4455_05435 [Candidatus Woesearchaeota archaeon]|nr:hypothetical protein [Candidatus Woesearchaeota archaeon]
MIHSILVSFILVFFLPGFLIASMTFKNLKLIERIAIGICLSIAISFIISIILGLLKITNNSYGFTPYNYSWIISIITVILAIIYTFRKSRK